MSIIKYLTTDLEEMVTSLRYSLWIIRYNLMGGKCQEQKTKGTQSSSQKSLHCPPIHLKHPVLLTILLTVV